MRKNNKTTKAWTLTSRTSKAREGQQLNTQTLEKPGALSFRETKRINMLPSSWEQVTLSTGEAGECGRQGTGLSDCEG